MKMKISENHHPSVQVNFRLGHAVDAAEKQKLRVVGDDGGRVDSHALVGERKPLLAVVRSAVCMAVAFVATGAA
jgi:hypothetical protein